MRNYAGAGAPLKLEDARALVAKGWGVQPKMDGGYTELHTDRTGRVRRILGRSGQAIPLALSSHLVGAWVGWPESVLIGEIEAYTERGNAAFESSGYRSVWLFDCAQADGRSIAREPYHVRREILYRMQSEVVAEAERSWTPVAGMRGRENRSGRYVKAMPEDWRLTPIVPWVGLEEGWARARAGEIEGVVLVDPGASLGKRGGKRKLKPVETVDGTVLHAGKSVVVFVPGYGTLKMGRRGLEVREGEVVEIGVESGMRFPRLLRARPDLVPVVPLRRLQ